MKYNKSNQAYEIIGRFRIDETTGSVEYCRVKFSATGHEQTVKHEVEVTGEFEDFSVVEEALNQLMSELPQIPGHSKRKAQFEISNEPVMKVTIDIDSLVDTDDFKVEETPVAVPAPQSYDIIATNPKGEDITVNSLELEAFCEENKLDLEVVQDVLDGKQKTHKKWRFNKGE